MLKCTKFDFCWGSAPNPAVGAYSAPPDPLLYLRGPTSKGRVGKREERGNGGKVKGKGRRGEVRKGEGREGEEQSPLKYFSQEAPLRHAASAL